MVCRYITGDDSVSSDIGATTNPNGAYYFGVEANKTVSFQESCAFLRFLCIPGRRGIMLEVNDLTKHANIVFDDCIVTDKTPNHAVVTYDRTATNLSSVGYQSSTADLHVGLDVTIIVNDALPVKFGARSYNGKMPNPAIFSENY